MSDEAQRRRATVKLEHRGRRSGRPYTIPVWFVERDGDVWIGSLDEQRNWVRNVRAADCVTLDFGGGPHRYRVREVCDDQGRAGFHECIRAKYPWSSRLMWLLRPRRASLTCFCLTPDPTAATPVQPA